MGYPHSYSRRFNINMVSFYHYHAQDAHGSVADTYCVDGESVTYAEFMAAIQKSVGDAEFYITRACGLNKLETPDWSKR